MSRLRRHSVRLKPNDAPVFMALAHQETAERSEWVGYRTSRRQALQMVDDGEAEPRIRHTDNGDIEFFQRTPKADSRPTPTTLTLFTMDTVSRQDERGLSGSERRELDKFRLWPFEGDRRNPATVRPRVGERECQQARAAMARATGTPQRPTRNFVRSWHAPAEQAA